MTNPYRVTLRKLWRKMHETDLRTVTKGCYLLHAIMVYSDAPDAFIFRQLLQKMQEEFDVKTGTFHFVAFAQRGQRDIKLSTREHKRTHKRGNSSRRRASLNSKRKRRKVVVPMPKTKSTIKINMPRKGFSGSEDNDRATLHFARDYYDFCLLRARYFHGGSFEDLEPRHWRFVSSSVDPKSNNKHGTTDAKKAAVVKCTAEEACLQVQID